VPGASSYLLSYSPLATGASYSPGSESVQVVGTSYTPTSPLFNDQTYLWSVIAIVPFNGVYVDGTPSAWASFVVSEPGAPIPGALPATVTSQTPTFQWSAVSGAATYVLTVTNTTSNMTVIHREIDATSFTPVAPLTNNDSYQWTVQAVDNIGDASLPSPLQEFNVSAGVGAPNAISLGTVDTANPTLQWSAVAGASGYLATITDVSTNTEIVESVPVVGTSYTIGVPLVSGQTYQWSVSAYDGSANVGPAAVSSFGVDVAATTISTPTPASPTTSDTIAEPTFEWSSVPGAAGYYVSIYDQTAETFVALTEVTTNSYTVSTPLANGDTFDWQISAVDGNGLQTDWSDPVQFTASIAAPTLTTPTAGSINENGALSFSSNGGNPIVVADSGSDGSNEQLAIEVDNGTLTLSSVAGLTIVNGANGSGSMTVAGSVQSLNAALNGLVYAPTPGYRGSDTLTVSDTDASENLTGSASVPILVTAAPAVVATDAGGLFDGGPFSASAVATGSGGDSVNGTFAFTYYNGTSPSGSGSSLAPVDAGTYTVEASFTSNDPNYGNAQSAPVSFTIAQASPVIAVGDTGGSYDGNPFSATATIAGVVPDVDNSPAGSLEGVPLTLSYYAGTNTTGAPLSGAPSNAGIYSVVGSFGGSSDYESASNSTTFVIAAATPNVTVSAVGGTYNGNPYPASATATGVGSAAVGGNLMFTYYPGSTVSGTGSSTAPTNAGTYTVVAALVSSNPDYSNAQSSPVAYTISQATPAVVATDAGGTYNGNPFPATATSRGVGGASLSGSFSFTYYVGSTVSGNGSSTPPTNVGTYTVVAAFTSGNSNYASGPTDSAPVTFVVGQAPAITGPNKVSFAVGVNWSFAVTASGYPAPTFAITAGTLPKGMTMNSAGVLSGTPAAGTAKNYPLTITANNGVGQAATQSFTLTVASAGQAPKITSGSSATFIVGQSKSFALSVTGSPTPALTETGSLPAGLTFNPVTGILSGIAGAAGKETLTFKASNGVGTSASQTFTLTIDQVPTITSSNTATFVVGKSGSFTVVAIGTPTPTFAESGTLPKGLTFNKTTGVLSGTPASGTAKSYALTFTATNSAGESKVQSFTLVVSTGATNPTASNMTLSTPATASITATAPGPASPTPTATTVSSDSTLDIEDETSQWAGLQAAMDVLNS
jgi:large repetitive protein